MGPADGVLGVAAAGFGDFVESGDAVSYFEVCDALAYFVDVAGVLVALVDGWFVGEAGGSSPRFELVFVISCWG